MGRWRLKCAAAPPKHSVVRAERRIVPPRELTTFVIDAADVLPTDAERERTIRNAARTLLIAAQSSSAKLPLLPETASEAMAMASDPNVPMNRLERVILHDTALTARMLAVASSPAYAGQTMRTLSAALQRLGTGTIRDILYQSVLECHVFRGDDERAARAERDHAVAVGTLSKEVCKLVGIEQEFAFICGLLHDIGRTALTTVRKHAHVEPLRPEDELAALELVHTRIGASMIAKWKLPARAAEAARRHHDYRGSTDDREGYSQIGHAVAVADRMVGHLGIGRPARELDDGDRETICSLGIDPAELLAVARATLG